MGGWLGEFMEERTDGRTEADREWTNGRTDRLLEDGWIKLYILIIHDE